VITPFRQISLYLLVLFCSNQSLAAAEQALAAGTSTTGDDIRVLLVSDKKATLSSQMTGRVQSIAVNIGDHFRKGASLLHFDCAVLKAKLDKAQADLSVAESTHATNEKLKEYQSVSNLELANSAAKVRGARAEVAIYATRADYCRIRAPYDGILVRRHVQPQESVREGQPLLDIIAAGTPRIQVFVPSHWAAWLHKDAHFQVIIDETGKRYPAVVQRLGGQVDAVSQTLEIRARFTQQYPELLPGMSGKAIFEANDTNR
jgi:RND family efflux transporter MFP subunit